MARGELEVRLLAQWVGRFEIALARREDEDLPGETEQEFLAECAALGILPERAARLLAEGWDLGQQRIDLEHLDVWSDGAWGADDPFADWDPRLVPGETRGARTGAGKPGNRREEALERHYGRSIWPLRRAA